MKPVRFRRQKTLSEVAEFLREHGFNVNGSSGLDAIAGALARHKGDALPTSRDARWAYVAEFIGRPAQFAAWTANKKAQKEITRAAIARRGSSADFYKTEAWMRLRYEVLRERGARCECCGATRAEGEPIQVDHVKPRSLFPELALSKANLQVLCRPCNLGKSNRDDTDWRDGATLQ